MITQKEWSIALINKYAMRRLIERETAEYLAKGGKITYRQKEEE